MTPRERVMTAFEHRQPDRVPMWCGASIEFWAKAKNELGLDDEALSVRFHDDFRRVMAWYAGPKLTPQIPGATSRNVWGIDRGGVGYGQALNEPLANATLDDINNYPWPDPKLVDVSHVRAEAEKHRGKYAILGGDWAPFWHDAMEMLGMENMFIKMYEAPEIVDAVLQHIVDYYAEINLRIFEEAADLMDIYFMGNDYGTQNGPMVSEAMFRRFLMPHQKRLIDMGHEFGLKTQLHCCGGIYELLPAMIEAGLDSIHAVQTTCRGMELSRLKKEFGDRIVFNGGIDSHHVLIEGDADCVRESTKKVLDVMMPGGGYIGGASHDSILVETPVENIITMFDTILEYGVYR